MAKRVSFSFLVAVLLMVFVGAAHAGFVAVPKPDNLTIIRGDEMPTNAPYFPSAPGVVTDSPGEIVGSTQYDYQTNGSTGNRIAVDSQNGIHFAWMNGIAYPNQREVFFNYRDASGSWAYGQDGTSISQVNGDGYIQLSMTTDDRAAVGYHSSQSNFVIYAVDTFTGFGIFEYFDPPDMLGYRCYWPYLSVDRNDNIHVIMTENAPNAGDPQTLAYTRSTDGGSTWTRLERVDTVMTISAVITSSPVSDKVAIVYTHPMNFDTQWNNDVYYVESQDGLSWDFANGKVNVTQYANDPDSLYAYTDCDAVYDYNDNLHIVWNALLVGEQFLYYPMWLYHYDVTSGAITEVTISDSSSFAGCDPGAWNLPIAKMSIGAQEGTNVLVTTYTHFSGDDCSAGGFANGEIYMQYSLDGGANWSDQVNLTNSPSPGCAPGDCDSDHWSSLAERVTDSIHVFYVNDKDAGGIPQNEGSVTDDPLLYLSYPTPLTGIEGEGIVPGTFALSQNYPNPFNARTSISFELKNNSEVELAVYDVTGAKVATLVSGRLSAGSHSVNWDASNVASGVYYYTLKANGTELTRKMTLLK